MAPSHVLVAMDGSPLAGDALEHALETFDCRLTVLNVVTPLDGRMSEGRLVGTDEERLAAAHERAERVVDDARERAETAGQTVETVVETGDPAETVLAFVEDHEVDHVVMGGHGGERGRVARRLLGTTATAVVGEAPVSVTIVR